MSRLSKAPLLLACLLFASFPIGMSVANVAMALFVLAFFATGKYKERWQAIRGNPVMMAALLLYGVLLLGATYSTAPASDITLHLTKYSKLIFATFLFAVFMLADQKWQQRCMQAYTAAMLFILASTWLNVWFVLPWSKTQVPGWGLSHHVFGDYITQNVMMAFFVLLALVRCRVQDSLPKRAAWLAVALLGAVSITHLSEGRSGYLLLTTVLLIFVFASLRGKMLAGALVACILGLGLALLTSSVLIQRFEKAMVEAKETHANYKTSSIGHRLFNYRTTPKLIAEHPLLGWGTGSYHTQVCRFVEKPDGCEVVNWHPHNQFLFFGADHGLLGILAYAGLIFSMVWFAMRDKNLASRTLLLGFAGLLAMDSMVNSPLWSTRENHFFTFMMALLAAMSSMARQPAAAQTTERSMAPHASL